MAAELAQLTGLRSVCDAVNNHLGLQTEQCGLPDEFGYRLVEWVDDVLAYLEQPGDPALAQKLLAPLPEEEGQVELLQGLTDTVQSAEGGELVVSVESADSFGELAVVAVCTSDNADAVAETLSEVIIGARDALSEDLNALSNARLYSTPYPDVLDSWIAQLAGMSMAAEVCGFEGLHSLCDAVSGHLESLAGSPPDDIEEEGMQLRDWTDNVLAYLQHSGDRAHAEKLVGYLPKDRRDSLADALLVPAAAETAEESPTSDENYVDENYVEEEESPAADVDAVIEAAESWPADSDTPAEAEDPLPTEAAIAFDAFPEEGDESGMASGILGILQEELVEVSQELANLAHSMTDTTLVDETAAQAAAYQYSTILGRISTASESLGLIGLRDVCAFVDENIGRMACRGPEIRAQVRDVLVGWPSVVLSYLNEPTDDNNYLSVINCLQNSA